MEPTSGIKTWQWVVTVLVIIALIVIGVMVFGDKGNENQTTPEETPVTVDQNAMNRIVISDQYPGNVVYISSVQVAQPSWVIIQDSVNGLPGKVIGSTRFATGINPGKVTLTQPMVDGGTYYAVIYSDSGSAKFDATNDVPLKDSKGAVIMKSFKASTTVSVGQKG